LRYCPFIFWLSILTGNYFQNSWKTKRFRFGSNSKVTHLPTNSTFETKSNNKGIYSLDNLQPGGPYKIEITEGSNLIYSNSNLQLSLGNNDLPVVEVNSSKEKTIDEVKLTANKKQQ
jgi:hypothetical protein